jgi:Flp pilus assembly secretin CpaC
MKRVWVGVFGGLLIASQLLANDPAAKKRIPITEAPPQAAPAAIQTADTVRVRVGSGNVLTFPSKVVRVAVGDEKIVAVHVVESRQILLQGLMPGRSTVFAWLEDGRRLRYDLVVSPRVEVLEQALNDLDPRIVVEASPDGSTLILSGKVDDEHVANQARQLAESMLGASANGASRVVNLLQFPGSNDSDLRLTSALAAVDPRIRLRRVQVGNKVSNTADAVVLEGRVKDIPSLVRAITLAELQLGGVGGKIEPLSNEPAQSGRNRNFSGGGLQRLQGGDAPASGLAAYVARGLILKSASGRVLSFLEVDELPQIMVSIRVLQVDRGRAKHLGIDYRLDGSDFSAGSFHQPGRTSLAAPAVPPDKQTIAGIIGGNIVGTFVNRTLAVAAAIDFLQQKDVARSVAEPNITTLSGESASVLIGGEVPIPTTTVGNTASVQGFLFQDFGVRLDIRPTLAPSGLVAMEISPSIIRPSSDLAVSGVPGFQVQSVQTTAKVAPGQTLVLGGLISFSDEIQKRGVPGLSEIPLMKHLFSWEGRTIQEQEILFVITPRILAEGPEEVAEAIQWRDVEPITAGAVVELPPADMDRTGNIESATLGRNGLPPSFAAPSSRRRKNVPSPAIIEDHAPPPPPPSSHSMENAPALSPAPNIAPRFETEGRAAATSGTSERVPTLIAEAPKTPPQPAPLIVRAEEAPIRQEPLEPEPKVVSSSIAIAKPTVDRAQTASSKPASMPSPSVEKKSPPEKEVAKVPVAKPLQSAPAPTTAVAPSITSQPIAKSTPTPTPANTQSARAAAPVPSATQTSAMMHEAEKPVVPASHQPLPAASAPGYSKKAEPVAVSAAPLHVTTNAPAPNVSVPSSTAAAKKSEPASSPVTAPSVRTVTSAPSATTLPVVMPRQPEKTAAVAPRQPVPFATTNAKSDGPVPAAQTKPVPMPATTVYPYRKPPEPETPRVASSTPSGALASAKVNDETRAWLTRDYRIEVVVSPHPGDAWTRLSKRVTGDARHWRELAQINGADEKLTSEARVKVPFEMLKPALQQEIIGKLLPKGSAAESDWKRMSGQR